MLVLSVVVPVKFRVTVLILECNLSLSYPYGPYTHTGRDLLVDVWKQTIWSLPLLPGSARQRTAANKWESIWREYSRKSERQSVIFLLFHRGYTVDRKCSRPHLRTPSHNPASSSCNCWILCEFTQNARLFSLSALWVCVSQTCSSWHRQCRVERQDSDVTWPPLF